MKIIDLFAGCGGLSKGFEMAEFKSVGFIEFWKPAIETYQKNFPGVPLIKKDITEIEEKDFKGIKADVIVGGPPCQGFSLAGSRNPKDKRNKLFLDYLRVVDYIKPKVCVMENVRGIYTMKDEKGNYVFNNIIAEFKKRGYSVKGKLLNSFNYEVPEKRQRVIILAIRNDLLNGNDWTNIYPKSILEKTYVKDVLDLPYEEDLKIQHIYEKNEKLMKKGFYLKQGEKISSYGAAGVKLRWTWANTITSGGRYIHPEYNRYISVRETARIQTFPDNFIFCGSMTDMYKQIGNAVPVNMAFRIAESIKEIL